MDGIAVSYNMSVDVFGRNLERDKGSRDPLGVGFKVTFSGQYDIENKRLCNISEPKHSGDAVNLDTLQRTPKKVWHGQSFPHTTRAPPVIRTATLPFRHGSCDLGSAPAPSIQGRSHTKIGARGILNLPA